MNFELLLGCNALLNEEKRDVLSEVTLELDDKALLLILNDGSIAMEHFLEGAEELFVVQVIGQALDDGDALTGGTLLVMEIYTQWLALFVGLKNKTSKIFFMSWTFFVFYVFRKGG